MTRRWFRQNWPYLLVTVLLVWVFYLGWRKIGLHGSGGFHARGLGGWRGVRIPRPH